MVVLGLGSNLGDRAAQLQRAVTSLKTFISDVVTSPVYECQALLPPDAPAAWNQPFLNMALRGNTTLSPHALLAEIKTLENALGRQPRGHWGPREIDIDILAYDNYVVNEPDLVIPHPALLQRDFALIPFADIAPDWQIRGKPARNWAGGLSPTLIKTVLTIL